VVKALKAEAGEGHLRNSMIFMCTDNSTVELAIVKGNCSSTKLFKLTLAVQCLEMEQGAHVVVSHVSGERMKVQGMDGVSRGQLKEGVSVGPDMLSFIPFHLSAIQRQPLVKEWIQSWLGSTTKLSTLNGCFERGHGILGEKHDEKGFWRHQFKPGSFIWDPPPGAATVAIEELRKAIIKRRHLFHMFVCPHLLKPEWFRQLYKAARLVSNVPPGADCWPVSMHEPLIVGGNSDRHQKCSQCSGSCASCGQDQSWLQGIFCAKPFLEYQRLQTMLADAVQRVLYFESRCPLPSET
jgi:hypothetical protein